MEPITIPWALLTAVISAISALLGVLITNHYQDRRLRLQFQNDERSKDIQFRKLKLEELYVLFEKWEKDISCIYLVHIPSFKGEYLWEDAKELSTKNTLQEKGGYQHFQAILNLHFSSLKKPFSQVYEKRGLVMHYCKAPTIPNTSVTFKAFIKAQEAFEAEASEFKTEMVKLSSEL